MLRLSCSFGIEYIHSDNEPIAFGTPSYWDVAIGKYCNSSYCVYGFYWKTLPRNRCNRITDYKQIWGLLGIPKGLMESKLDFDSEQLYAGMVPYGSRRLLECDAPVCFLIPKKGVEDVNEIWKCFLAGLTGCTQENILTALRQVVHCFPTVIALLYQCVQEAMLTVVCHNPEAIRDHLRKERPPESMTPHYRRFTT